MSGAQSVKIEVQWLVFVFFVVCRLPGLLHGTGFEAELDQVVSEANSRCLPGTGGA